MKMLWIILVLFFVDLITGSYTRKGINRQNLIVVNIDKTKIGTHGLTQLRRKYLIVPRGHIVKIN